MIHFDSAKDVRILIPRAALVAIYDECDRFTEDETGGRVVGTYAKRGSQLTIEVRGVIGPGPSARRSAVSFFQDGEYQERIFREIETTHPQIEHLGNWHTHHVNGLSMLSDGDIATYRRTVNHPNHNTAFFYALLVVAKRSGATGGERYVIKHYLFHRGDERVYEVRASNVEVTEAKSVWPRAETHERPPRGEHVVAARPPARSERVHDRDVLSEAYPGIRPYASERLGVYWRGPLDLIDGSYVEIIITESDSTGNVRYVATLRSPPPTLSEASAKLEKEDFSSARAALLAAERLCNRLLYAYLKRETRHTPSKGD